MPATDAQKRASKNWRDKNRAHYNELSKIHAKQWYETNRQDILQRKKDWYQEHKEEVKKASLERYYKAKELNED